jgi:hypothetical protein
MDRTLDKEKLFKSLLVHPLIRRLEERIDASRNDTCSNKRSDFKMSRQRPYFILVTLKNVKDYTATYNFRR